MQIKERFVLAILLFVYITIVVAIEARILPYLNEITIKDLAVSFLVFTLIYGLFLFLTTKYGVRAGRYISIFIILLVSLGPVMVQKLNVDFSKLQNINEKTIIGVCFGVGAIVYMWTYIASVRAYESKDL